MDEPIGLDESTAAEDDAELDEPRDERAEPPLDPGSDELADAWWVLWFTRPVAEDETRLGVLAARSREAVPAGRRQRVLAYPPVSGGRVA
jgi:hypothetical protein